MYAIPGNVACRLVIGRVTSEADHPRVIAHLIAPNAAGNAYGEMSAQSMAAMKGGYRTFPRMGGPSACMCKSAASVAATPEALGLRRVMQLPDNVGTDGIVYGFVTRRH